MLQEDKLIHLVNAEPFGYTFTMIDMFTRQSYLTVPSLISHLANHTPEL